MLPEDFKDSCMHGTTPPAAAEEASNSSDDEHSDASDTLDQIGPGNASADGRRGTLDDAAIPDSHWTEAYVEAYAPEHWIMNKP